jgi:hypothetical protein
MSKLFYFVFVLILFRKYIFDIEFFFTIFYR